MSKFAYAFVAASVTAMVVILAATPPECRLRGCPYPYPPQNTLSEPSATKVQPPTLSPILPAPLPLMNTEVLPSAMGAL